MPLYHYKVQDSKGDISVNSVNAASKEDLATLLKASSYKILSIQLVDIGKGSVFARKVSLIDKANLFRFLSTMIHAGLSVSEGSDVIKEETQGTRLKKILSDISYETRRGATITSVLSKFKEDFDPVILAIVKVGEESGTLDESFGYLSEQLTSQYEMEQKIKGSLAYPGVIVVAMLGMGVFMLTWVLPQIASSFMKLNFELPFFTKLIMTFGLWVGAHTLIFIGFIVGTIALLVFLVLLKPVRDFLIDIVSKVGPIKRVLHQIDVARYARTLSTLTKRGVPIIEALNITADTLSTPSFRTAAKLFGEKVSKGALISDVMLENKKVFPPAMIQTIKAGEKTGMLDKVLLELAVFYEGEVERELKKLTTLLEPIIILVIGVAVGAMVIMLIAPIYSVIGNLQSSMKK